MGKKAEYFVNKYQELFDESIEKRDKSLHAAIETGNRLTWEKHNAEVFILINVIEDFRSLCPVEEECIPFDEDSFFRT